jgi:hypothetical protein
MRPSRDVVSRLSAWQRVTKDSPLESPAPLLGCTGGAAGEAGEAPIGGMTLGVTSVSWPGSDKGTETIAELVFTKTFVGLVVFGAST